MKKMIVVAFLLISCFGSTVKAQDSDEKINYLIKPENIKYSGFVTFFDRVSTIDGELVLSGGWSIGAIINRNLYLGLYKMSSDPAGLLNYQVFGDEDLYITDYIDHFKHSGIYASYVFFPLSLVHFSIGATIGRGKADFTAYTFDEHTDIIASDRMLVFSPELSIEFNLLKWMKVGLSGGYQMASGVNTSFYGSVDGQNTLFSFANKDFSSPQAALTLTIGGLNDKVFKK